jgi:DNA-binding NtrC family response regulator
MTQRRAEDWQDATHDSVHISSLAQGRRHWVLEVGSPEGGHSQVLCLGDRVVIGSGRQADVRIDDCTVSHRHCALRVTRELVEIEDLASKNGVYVGRVRVPRAFVSEQSGAFVIGRTSLVVRAAEEDDAPNAEPIPGLVGASRAMQRVAAEVRRHARTRAPMLLQGESGTGKDLVASALHRLSVRRGTYLPLNVGALPEALADAELFGHRRGAFTGAVQSRAGAFEQAHGGTLFLDEIADLPHAIQVKLLRVVEDGAVRPLGSSQALSVDVRVVSASWADLEARVEVGSFRADLFHRLSTVVIRIPPLRERKSDIPELSRVLLARIRDEIGDKEITSGALAVLLDHAWPGNVRELSSVLYRAAMASPERPIRAEHVRLCTRNVDAVRASPLGAEDAQRLLSEHAGNVSAAARTAGVARSTFRSWLVKSPAALRKCEPPPEARAQNSPLSEIP